MELFQKEWIDQLEETRTLSREQWKTLLSGFDQETRAYAAKKAVKICQQYYGTKIFVRGLIEFTNYCRNDCYYCGIRRSNRQVDRYRLSKEQIEECCHQGWELGYRTFVLQGGEDLHFSDDWYVNLIQKIKTQYPECAITLSVGERSRETYQKWFDAGADRYLLRHETACEEHYGMLHPAELSLKNRMNCLKDLKEIGYQVGCGFMVGSPGQTVDCLAQDMEYIHQLHPQMVGIGPFLPAQNTPFAQEKPGDLSMTLFLLSLIRIMERNVLLPATTALGTMHPQGRELGVQAGANVVMPNLSPVAVREKYSLYDNKICTGEEAAECKGCLGARMNSVGYQLVVDRGDYCQISSDV